MRSLWESWDRRSKSQNIFQKSADTISDKRIKEVVSMPELKCTVQTCMHNQNYYCTLDKIQVGGNSAKRADETCCDSFQERGNAFSLQLCGLPGRSVQVQRQLPVPCRKDQRGGRKCQSEQSDRVRHIYLLRRIRSVRIEDDAHRITEQERERKDSIQQCPSFLRCFFRRALI